MRLLFALVHADGTVEQTTTTKAEARDVAFRWKMNQKVTLRVVELVDKEEAADLLCILISQLSQGAMRLRCGQTLEAFGHKYKLTGSSGNSCFGPLATLVGMAANRIRKGEGEPIVDIDGVF